MRKLNSYTKYSMNINMRKIYISQDKTLKLLSDLENTKSDKSLYDQIVYCEIKDEFSDYLKIKDKPKSEIQGRRRWEVGPLLGDRHGFLITHGCCITEFKKQYTINLFERLDIIIAYAFNIKLSTVKEKLKVIIDRYNMSLKDLSLLCLAIQCPSDLIESSDVLLSDLSEFSEIKEYLLNLIRKTMYNSVPILSDIDGVDFTKSLEVTTSDDFELLPVALTFKLLLSTSKLIKSLVVDFYEKESDGIILSQDFCSITFSTNTTISKFVCNTDIEEIELPLKQIV